MNKTEMIRVAKAMQTQVLQQRETLEWWAYAVGTVSGAAVVSPEEISDAVQTAQNHIDALQHIIDQLGQS